MKKDSLIRSIYLYIFSLLGLVLLIIGGIRFIDMGLKAFVFTEAEKEQELYQREPVPTPYFDKMEEISESEEVTLTEEEREAIRRWLEDYEVWQEKREEINPIVSKRHRDASINLAMILVGLPLYLYHWSVIRREMKS